jgi:hypothetical protein
MTNPELPREWPIDEEFDFTKHGDSLGLCGECNDPKICYRFKVCTSLMDAFDLYTYETDEGKLRITSNYRRIV